MLPTAATAVIMARIAEQVDQSVEKKFVGGRGIVAAFQPGGLTPPEKLASFSTIATKWVEVSLYDTLYLSQFLALRALRTL